MKYTSFYLLILREIKFKSLKIYQRLKIGHFDNFGSSSVNNKPYESDLSFLQIDSVTFR